MTQNMLTETQPARDTLTQDAVTPPQIPRRPSERTVHDDTAVTEHGWLRELEPAEVDAHLDAENAHTDHRTAHLAELQSALARELTAPAPPTELFVPVRDGGWWYLDRPRILPGHGLDASLSRVPDSLDLRRDAAGVPVLDDGQLLAGEQMLVADRRRVFGTALSAEHHLLARAELSEQGCLITVVDLATSEVIDQEVRGAGPDLAFSTNGQWLLYVQVDEYGRGHQIRRHRLGTPAEDDTVVIDAPDRWAELELSRSRDGSALMIHSRSVVSARAWHLDLADPTASPRSVTGPRENPDLLVEHAGDRLLVLSQDAAGRSELSEVPLSGPAQDLPLHGAPAEPRTLLLAREDEHFEGVEAFAGFAALQVRSGGLPGVRIIPRRDDGTFDTLAIHALGQGGELEAVRLDANPAWDQESVRYRLDSLLTPTTLAQYEMSTGEVTVLRQASAPRVDPEQYRERRLWVEAEDGTPVPVSLLHRRDVTPDGTAPGVLYGYGAFGASIDPTLALSALPLLDRGVVVAIAHVRGGGEMGPAWHHSAQRADKAVSFTDFVSCAEQLVESGWVAADRLGAAGSGAGGLLVAASANIAPDRFRAVVAEEPVVDPLASLLDPGVLLTLQEWAEWGDPAEEEPVYRALRAYSPAENIRETEYPAVLAQTVRESLEAPCTEAAVWIAELRSKATSDPAHRPILLRCSPAAGGSAQDRRSASMAWLLDQLGAAGCP